MQIKAINKYFNFQTYINFFKINHINIYIYTSIYIFVVCLLLYTINWDLNFNLTAISKVSFINTILYGFIFVILTPLIVLNYFIKVLIILLSLVKLFLFKQCYFFSTDFLVTIFGNLNSYDNLYLIYNVSSTDILSFFNNVALFVKDIVNNYLDYPLFFYFGLFFLLTSFLSLISLNYLGIYGVFIMNFFAIFLLWLSIIPYLCAIFRDNVFYYINIGKWMYLSTNYKINFDFFIDNVSLSFAFLTITIAVFVYLYTFSYFRYEPLVDRLILFLNSFVISMVFLVCSGNFIMLFLGWEMIGLTSFFLINFWSCKVSTLKSAFKAFSFNKASDLFLFFAIILAFNLTYTLDVVTFINSIHLYENFMLNFFVYKVNYVELISIFLLGSAFIKSAQFGAHIWLPDSMEAPVPASALIHSATLVSAGIYLLLRFTSLFELSSISFSLIAIIGSLTAFYGGLVSMYQSDTKRILAYSTISHCGFLMVVYTTGILEYVVLYLYVHGFFKAAVFLCVGNVIRFSKNNQDFKRMGMFYKYLPFDCFASFICLINLSGLPFTFGFYIKHLLFVGLDSNFVLYYIVLVNCLFGALTGLFYSYRLYYNVFFDYKKSKKKQYFSVISNILNSKYYSNGTIGANTAIIGLVLVAYVVSLFLFYIYFSKEYIFSNFSFTSYISFMDGFNSSTAFLNNVSFINWIVILIIASIIFTPWRTTTIRAKYLDSFFKFFMFIFWFYVFYFIIF